MRPSIILVCVAILAGLSGTDIRSFSETPNQTGSATTQVAPKRESFFDYALSRINHQDKDYGAILEIRPNAVVENNIDELYFWSNVVTLILLCVLAAIVLLQWRAADKREAIAATLISQLWNDRVSARLEIERRTAEFNQLVEAHNAEVERTLSAKALPEPVEEQANPDLKSRVEGLDKRTTKPGASSIALDTQGSGAIDSDLQQRNVTLERHVEAMRNTEADLRKRLNDTKAQLDQEKARNQTLKGA